MSNPTRTNQLFARAALRGALGTLSPFAEARTAAQHAAAGSRAALRRLESADPQLTAAWELLNRAEVAERFGSPELLGEWLARPLHAGWVTTCAGQVVAAACAHHLDAEEAGRLQAQWASATARPVAIAAGDGYLSAAATHPDHRRRGHHRRLVRARLAWFEGLGITRVHTVSWANPAGSSASTLRSCGFTDVASIDGYWGGYPDTGLLLSRR